MTAAKKIHCVICNKKCSGNVLRYQDQYYHKQCFELEQSNGSPRHVHQVQQQQHQQSSSVSEDSATLSHSISSALTNCAGCRQIIKDGQALMALDLHWHVWCFKCNHCQISLHGEYVAKDGKAYCEKDYQKLFGVTCVYCKRYITGKVLQAGDTHHFHPSCARCSKCGDPFVPGEEMYLQGEVTWHPRCGPGPDRLGTPEYLNVDPTINQSRAQSPSYSGWSRSRSSSRSQYYPRDRSVPRDMYSVLSSMRSGSSHRAKSPSMLNEEAIQLAHYPAGQKPQPNAVPSIERDDFPAPPFAYHSSRTRTMGSSSQLGAGSIDQVDASLSKNSLNLDKKLSPQLRASRPRMREINLDYDDSSSDDPQLRKEEEELSKIANGIGKVFLSTLREREKLRAWKRSNLDPRNASRTPSANRELPTRLRYEYPTGVDFLSRSTNNTNNLQSELGKPNRSTDLVGAHLRRSMPNVANLNHLHLDGPPKLYAYHLLVTSNYRLPPDVDRCHLERHLSNDEFQYLFQCDRLDFYRLPEWKRNDLKRRVKLF